MSISTVSTQGNALTPLQTLADLFRWRVTQTPDLEAYRQFDESSQQWVSYSWLQTEQKVTQFAQALATLQPERGARIAILLPNGIQAVCIDQAAMRLACVPVPMHALDNPASIAYIVSDSDATMLVATMDGVEVRIGENK